MPGKNAKIDNPIKSVLLPMKQDTKRSIVEPSKSGRITLSQINKAVVFVHVVSGKEGGWTVKQWGNVKVEKHFSKKRDALKFGKELSRSRHTGLYVHLKNGKVEEMDGIGKVVVPSHS